MFLLAYLMFLDLKHAQLLATCWTVRGSNTGGGEIFRTRPDGPWGPPSLLCNGYRVFPTVKRPRRGVDHPTPSSAEVKERVQLDLFCPSGPSWPVLGWNLYTGIVFKWLLWKLSAMTWTGIKFLYLQYTVMCLTSINVSLFQPISTWMHTTCHTLNIMPFRYSWNWQNDRS